MLDLILPPETLTIVFKTFHYVFIYSPYWLPLFLGYHLFDKWVDYVREAYWAGMGTVLLEIKLPSEVFKSPMAMEAVLGALHQTADESNWYQKFWKGQTRSWFSLEIVSIGGNIRFFIWCRTKYRNAIEAHLYSQYPGIEVHEVSDYTLPFKYDPNEMKLYGCQWKLSKPDPYPIKTYIDYGLDKDPKEEYKVDPMGSMLELLGTLTPGHNIFIQIIIRAHKDEQRKPGTWFQETDAWKDEAKKEIEKEVEKFRPKDKDKQSRQPTEGEKEIINALERSISKYPFDTGIRTIYFADKDKYTPIYLGGMMGLFKQFGSPGLNGFKASGWSAMIDAPWKSAFGTGHPDWIGPRLMDEYKLRRFFFSPHMGKKYYSPVMVFNSEELATMFHLPGKTVTTPTLGRIPSKKSEAPSNIPT